MKYALCIFLSRKKTPGFYVPFISSIFLNPISLTPRIFISSPKITRPSRIKVLVLIAQQSEKWAFECAISALSLMSQSTVFTDSLVEKGCVCAMVGAIIGAWKSCAVNVSHVCCSVYLHPPLILVSI
jgi:hypothetical protein